jgi:hypothetical protein
MSKRNRRAQPEAVVADPDAVLPEDQTNDVDELRRIVKSLRRVDVCVVWDGETTVRSAQTGLWDCV